MPYVDARGVRIWAEVRGSGPPLLLLMGLGASLDTWAMHLDAFAERFRVIAVDNRGAGRSDTPPPPWTVPAMAEDALAVLDALDVARAHVVGVSMGGMIAQELAIRHPSRVGRLVLAMSFARPDPIRRTFLLHRSWARAHGATPTDESVASLPWLLSAATMRDPPRLAEVLALVATMPFMSAEAYARQIDAILEHVTLDRLPAVAAPTLVLAAAEDVLTPPFLSEEIAGAVPGARLEVLPRGNHAALIEYPDDFRDAVLDWLDGDGAADERKPR
jgi:pimeloyl-ACP methyl ester carboxylesterase